MDLLIDLPCRRLRLSLDEGSDRAALLAEIRARRGADPPRCLADPGRPCGPGRPCAFRSRRDAPVRRAPEAARPDRAGEPPTPNPQSRPGAHPCAANASFAASVRAKSPFAVPSRRRAPRSGRRAARWT